MLVVLAQEGEKSSYINEHFDFFYSTNLKTDCHDSEIKILVPLGNILKNHSELK